MHKRFIAFLMFLSLIVLLAIMQTTAPSKVGPAAIVAVFALIYIIVACALALLFLFLSKIIKVDKNNPNQVASSMRRTRIIAYCSVLALAPTIVLAMQSVGQVQTYAYVLVGSFIVLALSYVHYQMRTK